MSQENIIIDFLEKYLQFVDEELSSANEETFQYWNGRADSIKVILLKLKENSDERDNNA